MKERKTKEVNIDKYEHGEGGATEILCPVNICICIYNTIFPYMYMCLHVYALKDIYVCTDTYVHTYV